MKLLRWWTFAATLGAFSVIVIGGYVSATGSGLACPDWPTCHGSFLPPLDVPGVAVEWTHRLATVVEGFLVLTLVVLLWWRHRDRRDLLLLGSASFALLAFQAGLGMVAVGTSLLPVVVTLHLGTAVAFFAAILLTTVRVWWTVPGRPRPRAGAREAGDP